MHEGSSQTGDLGVPALWWGSLKEGPVTGRETGGDGLGPSSVAEACPPRLGARGRAGKGDHREHAPC